MLADQDLRINKKNGSSGNNYLCQLVWVPRQRQKFGVCEHRAPLGTLGSLEIVGVYCDESIGMILQSSHNQTAKVRKIESNINV